LLRSLGARVAVADALDFKALNNVIRVMEPTHVVHLLTALPPEAALRAKALRPNNRVRIEGTANLLRASIGVGARRLVAESFVAVYGEADFAVPRNEDAALPPVGKGALRESTLALRNLEERLLAARLEKKIETVALRFGVLYGRDVPSMEEMLRQARAGRLVVPRGATGVTSFVHIDDAVSAIVAALDRESPSPAYNIVDDEPLKLTDYLSQLAYAARVPSPRQLPRWIMRLVAPVYAEAAFIRAPLSNAKARQELGWRPAHQSLRDEFPQPLARDA
jgi:nucleoside-diphosphate-sugar epimerase